jgi:RHS repeat-associated protein
VIGYRFNGKEVDEETGLAYYGARYYDNQLSMWLSVDPLAGKYPSYSPYVFTVNNPVKYIDPDGRWVPGVTDEGQVPNTSEEGDNMETLMSQYGVTKEQATEMMDYYYVGEGHTISGDRVKAATGGEIMKLQLKNASGDDMNHQLAFAFTLTDSREESEFNMNDYFAGIEETSNNSAQGTFNGFGTTQNPPQTTEVNWMGKKRTISFDYANKSDGRAQSLAIHFIHITLFQAQIVF